MSALPRKADIVLGGESRRVHDEVCMPDCIELEDENEEDDEDDGEEEEPAVIREPDEC
jgi:hypothetical protein